MKINRLKITEGDFIILTKCGMDNRTSLEYSKYIDGWVKSKGLEHVSILAHEGQEDSITIISVNDVFEDVVIKGKNE